MDSWHKLFFGDGDVFVDLTLLNILALYNYLYHYELGPVVSVENVSENLQILWKLLKIDYEGQ